MKEINIGILGCGVIGTGVAKILIEKNDLLSKRIGTKLNLKYISDLDTTRKREIEFPKKVLISDSEKIINDPDISIIVELIGGETIAKDLVIKALKNGKHVVTANKALLSTHGNELVKIARENQVDLAFEASTAGCIPIIKTLKESHIGNDIKSISAILNGTCNYILTKISKNGFSFEDALKNAQDKGFAEADPTLDIEGIDTAHKLAILNAIAHGIDFNLKDIHVEGISRITPLDIQFASEFGYTIKLLAISKFDNDHIEARVHPTMIPISNPLSNVDGSMNAVVIDGDATEQTMLYGHGAGMMPTASAVINDIADISRTFLAGSKRRTPILGFPENSIKKAAIMPMKNLFTRYYIRCFAKDHPGVLSKISGILGDENISIESVHQKGEKANGVVPIVMVTHSAKEENMLKAIDEISKLDSIPEEPFLIRIENNN
ncbi:MAG: homoserine dehydrogenase [Desulfobacteraceae bacterium]|nr:homoserine dehydrogenase [Desulfobacteraceae bacterium]